MSNESTDLVRFDDEVRPFVRGDILHTPVARLPVEAAVKAFAIIKHIGEILEKRRKELRAHLLEEKSILKHAEAVGKGGSTKTMVEGNKVNRKRTEKKLANVKALKELLKKKSIPESEVFDTVTKTVTETVVNPSKLEALVETGRLSKEDVQGCHTIQWTFTVNPSAEVKDLLEEFDRRNLEVRQALQGAADEEA
jgi:hypothetical protein